MNDVAQRHERLHDLAGDRVRLGMGNDLSLVHTASQLSAGQEPEAAILYSCVGRELVLAGGRPSAEARAAAEAKGVVFTSTQRFRSGGDNLMPQKAILSEEEAKCLSFLRNRR